MTRLNDDGGDYGFVQGWLREDVPIETFDLQRLHIASTPQRNLSSSLKSLGTCLGHQEDGTFTPWGVITPQPTRGKEGKFLPLQIFFFSRGDTHEYTRGQH